MKKHEILKRLIGYKTRITVIYNVTKSETVINWKTRKEMRNFLKFMESDEGSDFMAYCLYHISEGYSVPAEAIMQLVMTAVIPKVDWSREWTVEEILKEFNYTDNEIEYVFAKIYSLGPWNLSGNCIEAEYTIDNMEFLEKVVKIMTGTEIAVA